MTGLVFYGRYLNAFFYYTFSRMRIAITLRFINSYFSGAVPQQGLAIGRALTLAGHDVTYIYPPGETSWFIDVETAKSQFRREAWNKDQTFDIVIEVAWSLTPSDRVTIANHVVSFSHYPPIFFDMESSVYPSNPLMRSFENISAIWTYDHYSLQDVRYLEFLSGKKVFQVPYIWNPDMLDIFVKENSLPSWFESALRVDALIPASSSPATSWCARIMESNFSNSSHCIIPLNIVSNIRSKALPIRFTVHNGEHTYKNEFFKNNIAKNLILPDISGNMVPRVRLPDLLREKAFVVSHQRFRPIKSYLLDAYYIGIPVIHNCEILRSLGAPYFYELNQINQATECFVQMTNDCLTKQGFFDEANYAKRQETLRTAFSPGAVKGKYLLALEETCKIPIVLKKPFTVVKETCLRIAFCEMWSNFQPKHNFFTYMLRWLGKLQNIKVEIDIVNPNLVFFGPFSNGGEHKYPGVPKVFFTGENTGPNNNPDTFLNLGYKHDMKNSYIRLPLWVLEINWWGANPDRIRNPKPVELADCVTVKPELLDRKQKFCTFVASNPCNTTRNDAFQILHKWRPVDSAGNLFCNRPEGPLPAGPGGGGGELLKVNYYKDYQFALTFENSSSPGYTSEKIFHAKVAGCVPIYWGDAFVDRDFDSNGFINANQMGSPQGFIDLVAKVATDTSEWRKMASVPALSAQKKQWCEQTIGAIGAAIFKKVLGKDIVITEKDWLSAVSFGKECEDSNSATVDSKQVFVSAANAKYLESATNLLISFKNYNPLAKKILYVWPDVTKEMVTRIEKHDCEIRYFPCEDANETSWPDFWEPQHFAWKIWMLQHIAKTVEKGTSILYSDAGAVITKSMDSMWKTIQEQGVLLLQDVRQTNERWCHPTFCKTLNVSQKELSENQLWAGCIGFKKGTMFDTILSNALHIIGAQREVIVGNKWHTYSATCLGHRHDQSILSILTNRLGLPRQAIDEYYCDQSFQATLQANVPLYVHRGAFREFSAFAPLIDSAYVINLARRADRKKRFMEGHQEFASRVTVCNAIDGLQLTLNEEIRTLFRNNDFSWKKSVIGCALSHYGLWEKLARSEREKTCLILEDDVVFPKGWLEQWQTMAASFPPDADVVYLGGVLPPNKVAFPSIIDPVNAFFAKVKPNSIFGGVDRRYFHFCNYAYILTKNGAMKLCNLVKEKGIFTSGDHMIVNHGDSLLNIYFTTPLFATCYQENDPVYQTSQFNNFDRVDNFDSDLWNNNERFAAPLAAKIAKDECVEIWNTFLRRVALNERAQIPESIDALFQMWKSFDAAEFQENLSWFRVFEQIIGSKHEGLLSCSEQIRQRIAGIGQKGCIQWMTILSCLPEATGDMPVFHIPEVNPTGFLENQWLNSLMPSPISWKSIQSLENLAASKFPVLLYLNIPGRSEFVTLVFQKIIKILEDSNSKITLLHLSDEFGADDITIYSSPSVKQVIRTYWRPDLPLYGNKVCVIPLGYTKGHDNPKPVLNSFGDREHVWAFAGSMDRPGRQAGLSVLDAVKPCKKLTKERWGQPNPIQGGDYVRMLEHAKFVPCFRGTKSLESFRFYEALESGAIPIYVPSESSGCKDEYRELFGQHPFLGFPSWEKAAELLPKLANQTEIMEKHRVSAFDWWVNKKKQVKEQIHAMFR